MVEVMLVIAGLVGAAVGGGFVWRWSADVDDDSLSYLEPSPGTEWDALGHELERARRFQHPFVLLRLPFGAGGPSEGRVEAVLGSLRSIDFAWVHPYGIDVLLPELGREEGEACLARLTAAAPGLITDARLAVFPDDGVTRGAMLARLAGETAELAAEDDLPGVDRVEGAKIRRWAS